MADRNELFNIADRQQGYFTTGQAETCGFARSNFHHRLKAGEWIRELRGIYRLSNYPFIDRPELTLWTLWSIDKKGNPQGIWSHETALDFYELSDVMPTKMHLSVPPHFRKGTPIPDHLHLHYQNIPENDFTIKQGYRITKPLRTILDIIEENKVSKDQIALAIQQALQRGMIPQTEFQAKPILKNIQDLYGI